MSDKPFGKRELLEKCFNFSLLIIETYRQLKDQRDFDLSRQLLRSGTAIGANIEEAQGAQSRNDFINKMSIAYKESRECHYWLRLLIESEIIDKSKGVLFLKEAEELKKIISTILISTKKKNNK